MKPPIKVNVTTDNLQKCTLALIGADGSSIAIGVPSHGNAYQGLHASKESLERAINDILASNGVDLEDPESEEEPAPVTQDAPKEADAAP